MQYFCNVITGFCAQNTGFIVMHPLNAMDTEVQYFL